MITWACTDETIRIKRTYRVAGVAAIPTGGWPGCKTKFVPATVDVTFIDGKPLGPVVRGGRLLKSGEVSTKAAHYRVFYTFDDNQPDWLADIVAHALTHTKDLRR